MANELRLFVSQMNLAVSGKLDVADHDVGTWIACAYPYDDLHDTQRVCPGERSQGYSNWI
ncbi:hypothetical protein ACFQAT_26670 [Undibacterium arcticum]|uniref:Uncharacterized protein n=1 Tax=Undibacterium arcticum TaxID=1762892 RepID=A0ABV7EUK0_9BURK